MFAMDFDLTEEQKILQDEDAPVPRENMVGPEGEGLRTALLVSRDMVFKNGVRTGKKIKGGSF
jgi:hypothetical protein